MAPFALVEILGKAGAFLVYFLIGGAFGAVLELAGFGDSRRLAAQFYFKNMTVLKVMFTAIVTAMVLIFVSSALGILDYSRLWVNPTYLAPGVIGGLIMGVGFIIGGFCPGTSLVALASLKIDGLIFFLGVTVGVFLFGETVAGISDFWYSSYLGRFTLFEWLGVDAGIVVVGVAAMALFVFWGAEKLEGIYGGLHTSRSTYRRLGGGALLLVALVAMMMGQPTVMDKWEGMAAERQPLLDRRDVYIHPGELLTLMHNNGLNLVMLDLRDEADYNVFHLADTRRVSLAEAEDGSLALALLSAPTPTVVALMGNGEERATQAWKMLVAHSVINVYILDGGVNHWLDVFGHAGHERCEVVDLGAGQHRLRHIFDAALGANQPGAEPEAEAAAPVEYTDKVKLQTRKVLGGGCG
jgi:rhodanese-related sulfurtransferase